MATVGRLRRLSLLSKFSILSLVALAALGAVLAVFFQRGIEGRALTNAEETARMIASGAGRQIKETELRQGFSPRKLERLDESLPTTGVERVKIFNAEGRLVYSDDRSAIGMVMDDHGGVGTALGGAVTSEVEAGFDHSGQGDAVLEVYIPLSKDGRIVGAFEAYLPYQHVLRGVEQDVLVMYALLLGGLALVYLLLYRIVSRASRALRRQADRNRAMAREDSLTGLANRRGLQERTECLLTVDERRQGALMLIDLDDFKEVNDTLGHEHGDRLLQQVAERLRVTLRDGDCLARLGGDEFAIFLAGVTGRGRVADVAARLRGALERPYDVAGIAVPLEASIGVALCPEHGEEFERLMRHADVAMYEAKATRAGIVTYSPGIDTHTEERLSLAGELRRALAEEELVLHYQPLVSASDGQVRAVEALVRWAHPARGMLSPADFIELAQRTGDIAALTRYVLDRALRQLRIWRDDGRDLGVSVNLAAANATDTSLPGVVAALLTEHEVPADRLTLEISEETVMTDPKRVATVLGGLNALGVRLSLDDFGAGSSSLGYLRTLRLDELKIDRSFVMSMGTSEDDEVIVRSTVDLAHNLGLRCVAEGVEDAATAQTLERLGCETLQGYHFSRPAPAEELDAWLWAREVEARAS